MRRRVKQSTLVALALMLMLVFALVLIVQYRNSWVAGRLAGLATTNLLADSGYEMKLKGISWGANEGFDLRGLSIRYQGGRRESFNLFEAEKLSLKVRLRSLLGGDLYSEGLRIEGAVLRAFSVPSEGWAYPGLDDEGEAPSETRVNLESIEIRDFLMLREGEEALDSLFVGIARLDFLRGAEGLSMDVDSLEGRLPSGLRVESLEGRILLSDQILGLDKLKFRFPGSSGLISGNLGLDDGPSFDLSGHADSLRFDEVASLLGQTLETSSRLSGSFRLGGHPDSLAFVGRVSGSVYDYEMENVELSGLYGEGGELRIESALGSVNRNEVQGRAYFTLPLNGRLLGIDIEGDVEHFDLGLFLGEGPPSDLTGHALVSGNEKDLSIRAELDEGSFLDIAFGAGEAEIGLMGDSLSLRRVRMIDRGLDLELEGWILPLDETLDLRGRGRSRSSDLARFYSGDSTLTGDLDFNLRVHGSLAAPALDLNGPFRDAVFMDAHIDSGRVEIHTPALELEPIDLVLEVSHVTYWEFSFSKGFLRARVHPDSLELAYASLDGDPLSLTLAGGIPLDADPPRVSFERFWIHYMGEDWLNDRPLNLQLGAFPTVDAVQFLSSSGRLSLEWNRHRGGRSFVEWDELDLSVLRPWAPGGLASMGSTRGRLLLDSEDRLDLRLDFDDLRLAGQEDGHNAIRAHWQGDTLSINSLDWQLPDGGFLKSEGWFDGLPSPGDLIDGVSKVQWDSLGLDLDLEFGHFPLERMDAFLADSTGMRGRLTGNLHLFGPQSRLNLESNAELDSFHLGYAELDKIRWVAASDGNILQFHSLQAYVGGAEGSKLEGSLSLPLELSLFAAPRQDPDGPLGGELDMRGRLEDFHPLLENWLAVAEGNLEARIALEGTPSSPQPRGWVELRRGKLRPMAWEEEFVDLSATGRVEGDTLFLVDLEAREGLRFDRARAGAVQAEGWLTWRGPFRYEATASVSQFSLNTLPFFTGVLSGDLSLSTYVEEGQREHPYLEGSFKVSRGELHDLLEQSTAAGDSPTPLSYRLDLSSDGGLYLRDAEADLELAGDITISSLPSGQDISGILDIRRGRYTLFWHVFHLKEGSLDFNRSKGFNPELFIEAETRTRDDVITLDITGTLEEPQVGVASSLGYDEEDVLRILIGAPQSGQGWSESTGEAVGGTVSNQLVGRLESWASGELFSGIFDTVEIEGGNPLGGEETRWQVGRYLPGGFYVTYNHGLSLDSTWELGMENRLLNWMILRMEFINRGEELGAGTAQGEYNFDIRFRYEY
jgi:hypothetical protein